MESLESFESRREISSEIVRVRNDLQAVLMLEGAPFEKGEARDDYIENWFRSGRPELYEQVFDQLKAENPNLISDWEDLNKREGIIQEAKKKLGISGPPTRSAAA